MKIIELNFKMCTFIIVSTFQIVHAMNKETYIILIVTSYTKIYSYAIEYIDMRRYFLYQEEKKNTVILTHIL